jgi:hypothetical protein
MSGQGLPRPCQHQGPLGIKNHIINPTYINHIIWCAKTYIKTHMMPQPYKPYVIPLFQNKPYIYMLYAITKVQKFTRHNM